MEHVSLFPLQEYWWFYAGFVAFVLLLLVVDLGVFHRRAHAVSYREAVAWSAFWIALSLAFNYLFYLYMLDRFPHDPRLMAIPGFDPAAAAKRTAFEFLSGYVVEKSLSVDNIFVFVLVMSYFAVPAKYQHRVLFFGILGALVLRAAFIALGAALLRYQWVLWLFAAFLVVTGVRMLFGKEAEVEPEKNWVLKMFRRYVPITSGFEGQRFLVRSDGRLKATPLLVAVLFLEMTDILFAVDSVPAIFGLTREPLVVFTSNVFAILGLRALYFLLANAMGTFHLLSYGLGIILIFVGLKMSVLHLSIGWALGVIVVVLVVSVVLSLIFPKRERQEPK